MVEYFWSSKPTETVKDYRNLTKGEGTQMGLCVVLQKANNVVMTQSVMKMLIGWKFV